ncbi:MAG: PQQ-binding-like beta-propeller repeat protein [Planctomycetaceae bacterium]
MTLLARTLLVAAAVAATVPTTAADWPRFRGPGGLGRGESEVPVTWSADENLLWQAALPGPGSSSPVVHGDDVFVTCYSGYGTPGAAGEPATLVRHLLCIDRTTGGERWRRDVPAELPEDAYEGFLTEHGYASSTPVVDADAVYAFFGKSGVIAFDRGGGELWRAAVGRESSNRRWGSAASLIRHGDLVIVNASEESQSIRGLDRRTGREVWKAEAAALELAYGTPAIASLADGRDDLVVAVPSEIWGLDPGTGKIRWYATHALTGNLSPSVIVDGDVAYVFGGFRSAGSLAVRAGGSGDVTKSHVLWTSKASSYVATPLLHAGHLYWIDDRGQAFCSDATTGVQVYRSRVAEITGGGRPVYASPVLSGGRIYVVTRWNGTLVLPAEPRFEVLACNRFAGDDSDASGTPAIVDGRLYLRSGRFLRCVGLPQP